MKFRFFNWIVEIKSTVFYRVDPKMFSKMKYHIDIPIQFTEKEKEERKELLKRMAEIKEIAEEHCDCLACRERRVFNAYCDMRNQ